MDGPNSSLREQTALLVFLNHCFNSMEVELIRDQVKRLVSLSMWVSLQQVNTLHHSLGILNYCNLVLNLNLDKVLWFLSLSPPLTLQYSLQDVYGEGINNRWSWGAIVLISRWLRARKYF